MRRLIAVSVGLAALALAPAALAAPPPTRWCGPAPAATDRLPDLVPAFQVHVVYAIASDGGDRFGDVVLPIARDLAGVDSWWQAQDSSRAPRFDLHAFPGCDTAFGGLDVSSVRLPNPAGYYADDGQRYNRLRNDLAAVGFADPDKKVLVYYDGPVGDRRLCGQAATGVLDGGPRAPAAVYLGSLCGDVGTGTTAATVAVHELIHSLGALPRPASGPGPPHACPDSPGHPCDHPRDILFPTAEGGLPLGVLQLDVGRDDYYAHSGPWWDVQDSPFLARLLIPDQAPPSGPATLTATNNGRFVMLTWPAATDASRFDYRVYRNGELIARTNGTQMGDAADEGSTVLYGVRAADEHGLLGPRVEIRFRVGLGIVDETGRLLRDTVPPGAVAPLQLQRRGTLGVFRWRGVVEPGGLAGYELRRNGRRFGALRLRPTASVQRRLGGVWTVRAIDRGGNVGPLSNAVRLR